MPTAAHTCIVHTSWIRNRDARKGYAQEELVGAGHPKLMLANCMSCEWSALQSDMLELQKAVERFDDKAVLRIIQRIVPEFVRNVPQGAEIIPLQGSVKPRN